MSNQTDMQNARQFAVMFKSFADLAEKIRLVDDTNADHEEASKRLANRKIELEAASDALEVAKSSAEKIVADGHAAAAAAKAAGEDAAKKTLEDAQRAARQVIANATGDADLKKADLDRAISELTATRDRLSEEIAALTRDRAAAREDASQAQSTLDALRAELSALKSKF